MLYADCKEFSARQEVSHAREIAALSAAHARETAALSAAHARDIDELSNKHADCKKSTVHQLENASQAHEIAGHLREKELLEDNIEGLQVRLQTKIIRSMIVVVGVIEEVIKKEQ